MGHFYAVCYDIEDDRTRDRVARTLGEYGNRVQRSVFEIALREENELQRLRLRLAETGAPGGNIRFYRLCVRCRTESADLGGGPIALFPEAIIL